MKFTGPRLGAFAIAALLSVGTCTFCYAGGFNVVSSRIILT